MTVPSPRTTPFIGHLAQFALDPLGSAEQWVAECGDLMELRSPFGRSHSAMIRPSGSGNSAIASRPCAIASTRSASSMSRSSIAALRPRLRAAAISWPP